MARLLVFLVGAATLLAPGFAAAETPVEITGGPTDVNIVADRIEEIGPENLIVAIGNVEITRGNSRIIADRVELNRGTGDSVSTGHVIFYDGADRLSGPRLDYNLKNGTGVVYDARAESEPYYRLTGERMERLDESLYRIYKGTFTTCEDDPPFWSFHMKSATADFDNMLFGRDASFWVRNIPVIPFMPVFATVLGRERQTGFLAPTLGSSTLRGYFAKVPFYWAISASQDLRVSLDAYSKRGVGADAEYRYILSSRTSGSATGFFIQETEVKDDLRGSLHWVHAWPIDPTLSLKIDINHTSDDTLFRQYADRLFERSLQRTDSNIFLTKRLGAWNFVGNAFWYQDLTTPHPLELQRLPDLRLTRVRQPVPGLGGWALWDFESSFVHFVRDAGAEGSRLDIHPRVVTPFRPLGLFTFTPFAGVRSTTYDQTVDGLKTLYEENVVVQTTRDTVRTRALGELGADVETRATRAYDVNAGGIARVLHSVEPRINYTYTDGVDKDHNPQWDSIDALGRTNTFTYSLTNRLTAKTTAGPEEKAVRWELARLLVAQTFDADAGRRPFGNVTADLIVDPNRYFRLRADAAYSPYHHDEIRSVDTDVGLILRDITATIGTRYNGPAKIGFVHGEGTVRLSRYLTLRGSTDWDTRSDVFVENRVGADVRFQCWGLSLTFVNRSRDSVLNATGGRASSAENEFRFTLNLLGVGPIGGQAGF